MATAESNAMVGGDGAQSYAKNSSYQRLVLDVAKEMINEAIANKLDLGIFHASKPFQIADFGCSTGPNTFIAVQNIIDAVEQKCPFQSRLFPKSTLNLIHSSSALHWLSKVPEEILDRNSPAWNKGSIYCTGLVKEVTKAYSAQFKTDMESFLNARAQELAAGGLMVIVLSGLPNGISKSETAEGKIYDLLGSSLIHMANLGLISEVKVDLFNIPVYYPTAKEVEAIIKKNGLFSIERMNIFTPNLTDIKLSVKYYTSLVRAAYEGLVKKHFGNEFVDKIFSHFTAKIAENFSLIDLKNNVKVNIFFVLKRFSN
ncbi:hypothetical protein Pint_18685 [Pistacia integerrima]|uniref:Uncharacterized protein n=1 Tax=Pistacia integerrima TaxID=434235 RepID=A0ACC0YUQ6_9ROSI|nr:hypothetical protein Pint_18685 [Pistacia integerrima]